MRDSVLDLTRSAAACVRERYDEALRRSRRAPSRSSSREGGAEDAAYDQARAPMATAALADGAPPAASEDEDPFGYGGGLEPPAL